MKHLLLDTHVFLWWLMDDPALQITTKTAISNPGNQVYISAATVWELSIKQALGKVQAPDDLSAVVQEERFFELPITLSHAQQAGRLPRYHKDPFDRMLIAQAQAEGLLLVTHDPQIVQYSVQILPA